MLGVGILVVPKKLCSDCGQTKPANIKYFEVCHQNGDNLRDWCIECGKERARKYSREKNRELTSRNPQYFSNNARNNRRSNPKQTLFKRAKDRAAKKGFVFTITLNDVPDIPDVCPVFGFKLEFGSRENRFSSPSLDRIDNTKGYVPGNLQVISYRANQLKSNGTLEEFRQLVVYLEVVART